MTYIHSLQLLVMLYLTHSINIITYSINIIPFSFVGLNFNLYASSSLASRFPQKHNTTTTINNNINNSNNTINSNNSSSSNMISPRMGEIFTAGLGRSFRSSQKEKVPSSSASGSTSSNQSNSTKNSPINRVVTVTHTNNINTNISMMLGLDDDGGCPIANTNTHNTNINLFTSTIESDLGKHGDNGDKPRDGMVWEGLDLLSGFDLAEELRSRMRHASSGEHVSSGDDFDEFIKSQFDDEDFERTDNKEMDMRRVRDVSKIMAKIRKTSTETEISGACEKLMDTISMWPEVTDHFIKHFGVTPIFDIFDACIGSSSSQTSSSSSASASVSINPPYQCTLFNAPSQHTQSTHPINSPNQCTLSTHPINTPYQTSIQYI